MTLVIRPERAADQAAVDELVRGAFGPQGDVVADLVGDLRRLVRPDFGTSLVAVDADEVVGHVLLTPSFLDAPSELIEVAVLSPLAVRPDRQRQDIGTALVDRGVEVVAAQSVPLVFLEGDPAYYARQGFVRADELDFRRPSLRIPPAAFQVRPLATYQDWMTGTLVYAQTFWDHDCVGLRP